MARIYIKKIQFFQRGKQSPKIGPVFFADWFDGERARMYRNVINYEARYTHALKSGCAALSGGRNDYYLERA